MISFICGIFKKDTNKRMSRLADFEKLTVTKGDRLEGRGVWDGNVIKLGCDDSCTTINIIKFI